MKSFLQHLTEAGIQRKWRVWDSASRAAHHTFRSILKSGEAGPSVHHKNSVVQSMRKVKTDLHTEISKRAPRIERRAAAEAERVLGPVNPYGGIAQQLHHEGDVQRLTHVYRKELEQPIQPPSFITGKQSRFSHLLNPLDGVGSEGT